MIPRFKVGDKFNPSTALLADKGNGWDKYVGGTVTKDNGDVTAFRYNVKAVTGEESLMHDNEMEPVAAPGIAIHIKPDTQLGKVLALTLGQGAWTLAGIASVTGASEAAVSARLRDLRAAGYEVTCTKLPGDAQRNYTVRTKPITVDSNAVATVG